MNKSIVTRAAGEFDVWSPDALKQLVGDNPDLHQRLLKKFLHNAQAQVSRIESAILVDDVIQAGQVAHTLK